jgi:hypothetical protein
LTRVALLACFIKASTLVHTQDTPNATSDFAFLPPNIHIVGDITVSRRSLIPKNNISGVAFSTEGLAGLLSRC